MTQTMTADLTGFYQNVRQDSYLLSDQIARRWAAAVLKTLGFHQDRRTKRALAKALPKELAEELTSVFWLLHFRDPNLTSQEFQKQVAKRSGHTDANFARVPILAVFGGIKAMIDGDLSRRVAGALSPEVRELWEQAG